MACKIFIVARGNVATYESLRRTVGREPGVEVVYDRRPAPPRTRLARLGARVARLLWRRRGTTEERRSRLIDAEIQRTGWAVVHPEVAPLPDPPPAGQPSPGAPRLDHTRSRV